MSRIGVLVQARMGSSRLPGKVLLDLGGKTVLERVVERAKRIRGVDDLVIAIPMCKSAKDLELAHAAQKLAKVYAGSELDVLNRYYGAARVNKFDTVVRITADCPLLDPDIGSEVVARFKKGGMDYVSNVHPPTFPDGLDIEVFSFEALQRAWYKAKEPYDREHVTPYIWKLGSGFRKANIWADKDYSSYRWTLDTHEDYEWVSYIYKIFGDLGQEPTFASMLAFCHFNPEYSRTLPRA